MEALRMPFVVLIGITAAVAIILRLVVMVLQGVKLRIVAFVVTGILFAECVVFAEQFPNQNDLVFEMMLLVGILWVIATAVELVAGKWLKG